MDLEIENNNYSYSYRTNSCFSNFFNEENNKTKQKNANDFNNIFNYNIPNISNKINDNTINIQINSKYPFKNNNENMNNNLFISTMNINQNLNNSNSEKQSRFIDYFQMDRNKQNIPSSLYINNWNNQINENNKMNIVNNQIMNQNQNYNYIFDNNDLNLKNKNYINDNSKNLNSININNFKYNEFNNNLKNIKYINTNINDNINAEEQFKKDDNNSNKEMINNVNIPKNIIMRNADYKEFLNYVNNLNMPLIKYLCTKKGISEMENYLNNHKKNNLEILIFLLNKEGLTKLMKHKFGNYFIQEIIKDEKYPETKLMLELISQNFVDISESNSGTHVLQTLLDKVNNFELRNIILKSIENKELEMAFNNNATYVLQKIIGIIPDIERLNMNEIIINNAINLALDSDCVFIVEKFINTITIKENKTRIKDIICQNCIQLAISPYGNYLIQYLFQIWKNDDIDKINDIIIENSNFLVKQRYSSNVIEKAVDIFDNKIKAKLIRNLSLGGDILELIKNQYGHYVLNKAVKYMDQELKSEIESKLFSQMTDMTKKEKTKSKKFIANLKKNGKIKKIFKSQKK